MPLSDARIIRRSLTARPVNTIITALSLAVAVALLIALLSLRRAGEQAFAAGSGNIHLIVSRDASPLDAVLNQLFYKQPPQRSIAWSEYERLAGSAPFEWAIPTQIGDSYSGFPVVATTPDFFSRFQPVPGRPWKIAPKRPSDHLDPRFFNKPFEIVLGHAAARHTGLNVGDSILLTHGASRPDPADSHAAPHVHDDALFFIVGILEPTGSAHDRALFTDLDSSWILHAADRLERAQPASNAPASHSHGPRLTQADLTDQDRLITAVFLRVATRPGLDASAALQSTFDSLRRDPRFTVAQPVQQINFLFSIVSRIDWILLAIAALVLLSSSLSITLTMFASMDQRRKFVAILRVLGCSAPRIFSLVLTESAFIGLLGALLGLVLSFLASHAAALALQHSVNLVITPTFSLDSLAVVLGAVVLAALAGLIPAFLAYRTPVARHLR